MESLLFLLIRRSRCKAQLFAVTEKWNGVVIHRYLNYSHCMDFRNTISLFLYEFSLKILTSFLDKWQISLKYSCKIKFFLKYAENSKWHDGGRGVLGLRKQQQPIYWGKMKENFSKTLFWRTRIIRQMVPLIIWGLDWGLALTRSFVEQKIF